MSSMLTTAIAAWYNRSMMSDLLPPPICLGLPARYAEWRNRQDEAALAGHEADSRFVALSCPTGFGKSLAYMAHALLNGGRVAFLTGTKGLQDQLIKDFREIGLEDVRGMNSYLCLAAQDYGLSGRTSANEAPCTAGAKCPLRDNGCLYYDAVRRVLVANLVITNYAYWFNSNRYSEGLGRFDLLVLDEAHNSPGELSKFLQVKVNPADLAEHMEVPKIPLPSASLKLWKDWAQVCWWKLDTQLKQITSGIQEALLFGRPVPHSKMKKATKLKYLLRGLEAVATAEGEWAVDAQNKVIQFEPVWPAPYAERYLFRGIQRIVLYSATIRPKTGSLLGIGRQDMTFREFPSTFDLKRRPVYHVPTVSVKHGMSETDISTWATRIDQIVRARSDRKGIVHVTSYQRRDALVSRSEFKGRILHHSSDNTAEVVEKFRRLPASSGAILVSPSVTTGWDFPMEQCEYQVIAKVPFPDFTSEISRARDGSDADWSKYEAMQTLIQTTGRGMRSEDDQCETIVVDDNVLWFVRRHHAFAPKWWLDSFSSVPTLPRPLPKL